MKEIKRVPVFLKHSVVSRSLRQRFACRRTQLCSLEVISRDVGLTSKLIYDVIMHTFTLYINWTVFFT